VLLDDLLRRAGLPLTLGETHISGIAFDSRRVLPGSLFVAVPGHAVDGHDFAGAACAAGAAAVVAERPLPAPPPVVMVRDARAALAALADAWHDRPSERVRVVGVTGTKGKTTTTYLLRSILAATGHECGLLGTIAYEAFGRSRPSHNTTPDPLEVQAFLAALDVPGAGYAAMEVSSHALVQRRTEGVRFAVGVFTNLSGDHLDYHGTMERYLEAKARLFDGLAPGATAVIHAGGDWEPRLRQTRARVLSFGVGGRGRRRPDVRATRIRLRPDGTRFELHLPDAAKRAVRLQLVGRHNVENALAAAAAAHALGVPPAAIACGLEALTCVPGRLEPVVAGQPFTVLVDYAHTDDALARVLEAVRAVRPKGARVHCLFGCGGDRDRTKRPRMAAAAERLADRVVVTSDNPRTEAPLAIIADILEGFGDREAVEVEPDREAAIARVVGGAAPGDIVLIAGKGHETYQIVGQKKLAFDDREVARSLLARRPPTPWSRPRRPRPQQRRDATTGGRAQV
jgi:UDP-N-acetylmuramoyl-L-alanyl-D-glutamate--2,6-diaminopimelate ligase